LVLATAPYACFAFVGLAAADKAGVEFKILQARQSYVNVKCDQGGEAMRLVTSVRAVHKLPT
jgi:hypothetical protein